MSLHWWIKRNSCVSWWTDSEQFHQIDNMLSKKTAGTIDGDSVHDDVIHWKHVPRYRPFVRGIHRSPVISPHKGQWRGALMFSLIWTRINGWVNNGEAGDLRRYCAHYDVTVMIFRCVGVQIIIYQKSQTELEQLQHHLRRICKTFTSIICMDA